MDRDPTGSKNNQLEKESEERNGAPDRIVGKRRKNRQVFLLPSILPSTGQLPPVQTGQTSKKGKTTSQFTFFPKNDSVVDQDILLGEGPALHGSPPLIPPLGDPSLFGTVLGNGNLDGKPSLSTSGVDVNGPAITMPGGYFDHINKRGKYYFIKKPLSLGEDAVSTHSTRKMAEDLYEDSKRLAVRAGRRAEIFKMISNLSTIFIIVASFVIGVISLWNTSKLTTTQIATSVIGFVISAVGMFNKTFNWEKHGINKKKISLRSRAISRELDYIIGKDYMADKLYKKIQPYFHELDDLVLGNFNDSAVKIGHHKPKLHLSGSGNRSDRSSENTEVKKSLFHRILRRGNRSIDPSERSIDPSERSIDPGEKV